MLWWAWVAVGAILLGSELAFVDAQFYLVFIGSAALIVGLVDLTGLAFPAWLQWSAFALLAALSMISFRRRIYEKMRSKLPTMRTGPQGETVVLPASLPPGETCRLEFRGCSWTAVNGGQTVIAAGARARIERVDGLTLVVQGEVQVS